MLISRNQRSDAQTGAQSIVTPLSLARLGCLILALLLLSVNLTTWPVPWFDEGLNLSTAATIAREGFSGLPDAAGTRVMDPAIQTGPVVVVPVAIAFELFGVGLLQARLVMLIFGFSALAAFYLLARRLHGEWAALAGIVLLLAGNAGVYTSFVPMARHMLGEVAALGLFCYGVWLWLRSTPAPGNSLLGSVFVGLAFGLGMVTKSQLALNLPLAMGLVWLADLFYYRSARWWSLMIAVLIAVGCVLSWYGYQLATVGQEGFARNSAVLREGFGIHIIGFSTQNIRNALRALWDSGFLLWGLPGLLYGLHLARQPGQQGLAHALPVALICTWLLWFSLLSIGWARYAAMPLMLLPLYSGRLLADLITGKLRLPAIKLTPRQQSLGASALFVLAILLLGRNLPGAIFGPQDNSVQQLAAYLREYVPADALVENWEWELNVLAPQAFHQPHTHITNIYTIALLGNQPLPHGSYDPADYSPDYLIDGPFSSWTQIYRQFIEQRAEKLVQFGGYALYRVKDSD